ncbi:hypothetical protein KQX54_000446 [Cotesia glomerata]|uniref:Uncharacterized protein n=1 Tax=Cotesia glomerata TaxID=32391 RepID=A0AAV7HUW2_COTGL|nr:hypothetical protein KQX54_000446 [Cotesia glomerata]
MSWQNSSATRLAAIEPSLVNARTVDLAVCLEIVFCSLLSHPFGYHLSGLHVDPGIHPSGMSSLLGLRAFSDLLFCEGGFILFPTPDSGSFPVSGYKQSQF